MCVKRKMAHVEKVEKMNVNVFLSYTSLYLPGKKWAGKQQAQTFSEHLNQ